MVKETMFRLLFELMKNSKRSDREISKTLHVSQPTITRMRKQLEKMGYIQEYTIIPDLAKIDLEIAAITFMNVHREHETYAPCLKWVEENPNVLFAAGGDGLNRNCMMVSVHKDYTHFSEFMSEFRSKWGAHVSDIGSFLVSVKGTLPKRFSFKSLGSIKR